MYSWKCVIHNTCLHGSQPTTAWLLTWPLCAHTPPLQATLTIEAAVAGGVCSNAAAAAVKQSVEGFMSTQSVSELNVKVTCYNADGTSGGSARRLQEVRSKPWTPLKGVHAMLEAPRPLHASSPTSMPQMLKICQPVQGTRPILKT